MARFWPLVLSLAALVAVAGCGESDEPSFAPPAASCPFGPGALPADTLPATAPHGDRIPIQHIIVVMQENHSFDSYFGQLPAAGKRDVDGLPADASNPDANGMPVFAFHQPSFCTVDTNHSWTGSHLEYDTGKNDGFVVQNDPDGARAMGYYDESDLPYYYALAKTFAIGDRYFCSLLVGTFSNRFYLMAGTSFGHVRNDMQAGGFVQPSIFDLLDAHGISWKDYFNDFPYASLFHIKSHANVVNMSRFFSDAAAGTLPQVAFVDSNIGLVGVETDEHPPSDIQQGQQFVASAVQAVMDSPEWPSSVIFFTYDEHGGFYDHVPPPPACVPDDIPPMHDPNDPDTTFPAQFDRYGFRVPVVVISPYAKPGYVSHTVYDHTSILRFIETRFDLPALTRRDANASPMLDMFDFADPAFLNPPALPQATVDAGGLQQCQAEFPGKQY
jgi:phospholipase C